MNIGIALTGIGLICQIIKAAIALSEDISQQRSPVINNYLFFGKTNSQEYIEQIDHEIDRVTFR